MDPRGKQTHAMADAYAFAKKKLQPSEEWNNNFAKASRQPNIGSGWSTWYKNAISRFEKGKPTAEDIKIANAIIEFS